jgi:hypothetical protein
MSSFPITDIVLDFDGTCTQIPAIWKNYTELYLQGLREAGFQISDAEWVDAQQMVRSHSHQAGWTLAGCPAAPAAADPYILADESARLILRRRNEHRSVPASVNSQAYQAAAAPWRDEALATFSRLNDMSIRLHFVSNSSTEIIKQRLIQLLGSSNPLLEKIAVQSDAGKFRICELNWDELTALPGPWRRRFAALPVALQGCANLADRPVYLRRGAYFEAIYRVLRGKLDLLPTTLFCGDIWEMDLAMPYELGACVHLLERASPFETYDYELVAVRAYGERGRISSDLSGLLAWV